MAEISRFFLPHRPVFGPQEKFTSLIEAGPRLLHEEMKSNLLYGDPIRTNKIRGEMNPYLYQYPIVSAVAGFMLNNKAHFSDATRANAGNYIYTFGFPMIFRDPLPQYEISAHPLWSYGFMHPNFHDVSEIQKDNEKRPIVFLHGRFNGFPHPGIIGLLAHVHDAYPDKEVWVGLEDDTVTIAKGQKPFLDYNFRATTLAATGLVNRILLTHAPSPIYGSDKNSSYWDNVYSIVDPEVIVIPDSVPLPLPELKDRTWTQVAIQELGFYYGQQRIDYGAIHQTKIKGDAFSYRDISTAWHFIRDRLARLK